MDIFGFGPVTAGTGVCPWFKRAVIISEGLDELTQTRHMRRSYAIAVSDLSQHCQALSSVPFGRIVPAL